MKLIICLFLLMGFIVYERNQATAVSIERESHVYKRISLKELTTGIKAGKEVEDGLVGKWSYFGKERVVQTEQLSDGTIAAITVLMDGADAFNLQQEIEAKFSKEEGRTIRFHCDSKSHLLPELNNAKVWDKDCILQNDEQVLTIQSMSPNETSLIREHYESLPLFYFTKVTLVDAELRSQRRSEIENREKDANQTPIEKAKKDI